MAQHIKVRPAGDINYRLAWVINSSGWSARGLGIALGRANDPSYVTNLIAAKEDIGVLLLKQIVKLIVKNPGLLVGVTENQLEAYVRDGEKITIVSPTSAPGGGGGEPNGQPAGVVGINSARPSGATPPSISAGTDLRAA